MTDNTGPSEQTLAALKLMLPSLKKGLREGTTRGKGKISIPRKFCKVCGRLWDRVLVAPGTDTKVVGCFCGECQDKLDQGWVAIVHGDQYLFTDTKECLEGDRGKVVPVSEFVMKALKERFKEQVKTREDAKKNGHPDSR